MKGMITMDLAMQVGEGRPLVITLMGELDKKVELDAVFALLLSYEVQMNAAQQRFADMGEGKGDDCVA